MREPRPCGSCVRAEFADDDSDELIYIAAPGATIKHVRRPANSEGKRGAVQSMVWLGRGGRPYTYCGQPVGDDWRRVDA